MRHFAGPAATHTKLLITLIAGCWLATGAQAAEVTEITYDLASSEIVFTEPFSNMGPLVGTLTIGFESEGGMPLVSGAVSFKTLMISANPLDLVVATGRLLIDLTEPMTGGHLDPGNVLNGAGVTGFGTLGGTLACVLTAVLCDALGIPTAAALSGPFPLSMGSIAFATFGSFTQVQPFSGSLGDIAVVGTFNFAGSEISRTTIAEPSTLLLQGVAVAVLSVIGRRKAKRHHTGLRASPANKTEA